MRKALYCVFIFLIIIICQFVLGRYLSIFGGFPNLILITIVFLSMTKGRLEAVVAGFLFGIIWDVFSVDIFGMRMLLFPVIGYAVGLLGRNFDKDQLYTQAFIIFIANLIFLLGQALIYSSFYSENIHIFSAIFNLRNLFCLVLTVIFAIPSFLLLSIADNYFSKKRH